jgi:hypothetical protein
MFKVAIVFAALVCGTQAFGQRAAALRNPCEELPAVLKRAHDDCFLSCSRQREAKEKLPVLIAQCNALAKARSSEKLSCPATQDYIKRAMNMDVPEGLTCK